MDRKPIAGNIFINYIVSHLVTCNEFWNTFMPKCSSTILSSRGTSRWLNFSTVSSVDAQKAAEHNNNKIHRIRWTALSWTSMATAKLSWANFVRWKKKTFNFLQRILALRYIFNRPDWCTESAMSSVSTDHNEMCSNHVWNLRLQIRFISFYKVMWLFYMCFFDCFWINEILVLRLISKVDATCHSIAEFYKLENLTSKAVERCRWFTVFFFQIWVPKHVDSSIFIEFFVRCVAGCLSEMRITAELNIIARLHARSIEVVVKHRQIVINTAWQLPKQMLRSQ